MVPAIDIHAHVFNLRYLPVAGILDGSGLVDLPRWLARALAFLALAATPTDGTLDAGAGAPALSHEATAAEAAEAVELDMLLDDFDSHIELVEARIPEETWQNPEVQDALARARAMAPAASPKAAAAAAAGLRLRILVALAKDLIRRVGGAVRAIDWVFSIATARERTIVRKLVTTYGDDVELFVHHMMDMKNHYRDGETKYEFAPRQVARMETLSGLSGGRLATFVAWDPFRRDGLAIVQDAIDNHGCIGVKVYPPSGYRPCRNDRLDWPSRHVEPPPPEVLDARSLALFQWCAAREVPVFTHCTPHGFEAYENSGANGSPTYWRNLLEDNQDLAALRLCLGHAGGDGWFARNDDEWTRTFAEKVADLCTDARFPNVYCEVGILSEVHEREPRRRFAARLRAIAARHPQILRRLLYGSDWHMLYMHPAHREFFQDYVRFCADAGFTREQTADFFRNNAVRYLNLGEAWLRQPD